jgi:hypothetical protein
MCNISKNKNQLENYKIILFCIDNNIKHIFSNNVKDIETKIKSIYGI